MMLDHPWLGIGLGQYEYVSTRYAFPIETHWAKYSRVAENAHSEYLQAGAELGVPGLLIALGARRAAGARRRPAPARAAARRVGAGRDAAGRRRLDRGPGRGRFPPAHAARGAAARAAGRRACASTASPARSAPSRFRVRPVYAAGRRRCSRCCSPLAAARPVVGFWYYLGGIGAPRNLLQREVVARGGAARQPAPRGGHAADRPGRARRLHQRPLPPRPREPAVPGVPARRGGARRAEAGALPPQLRRRAQPEPVPVLGEPRPGDDLARPARAAGARAARGGARPLPPRRRAGAVPAPALDRDRPARDELGDTAAAEAAFRRAVAIEEYFLRGWFNLGTFYARHGRLAEAREAFARGAALAEKARSLVPTSKPEAELLAVKPRCFLQ